VTLTGNSALNPLIQPYSLNATKAQAAANEATEEVELDPTVRLYLGSYGGPSWGGLFHLDLNLVPVRLLMVLSHTRYWSNGAGSSGGGDGGG